MYMWAVYGFRAAAAHFAVLKKHCPLFVIVINVELSVGVVSGKNKGCLILGDEGFWSFWVNSIDLLDLLVGLVRLCIN
ncbi:hypothetical protein BBOMB_0106 [Bifidobacterium bombi DSM 19703]|uniref:Uncharacterized protein n=1 Tax=Bifidobacterium bombi DSM 19703 TaxID=1341695 RepID=A0A080N3T4_9BIFI|nr:hypothetical protein BBOMB_0106 [Bifidobacterium bombi DSM 19703]